VDVDDNYDDEGKIASITSDISHNTNSLPHQLIKMSVTNLGTPMLMSERYTSLIVKKTFKFKIGVLWATIAQKQQIPRDFI
jgi:hypothetical protein